jgi:nucleoside-diphosphate-sugar epimerase
VLAGLSGRTSSQQLVEYNLGGTLNLSEYCKIRRAGFVLLSTSRVYSIPPLANLMMSVKLSKLGQRFQPLPSQTFPEGVSTNGISEEYSTSPPVSLYGSTKVASEHLALEYGSAFGFPVWINRCGVMAGAGQFGHPAQGIFAFWIHSLSGWCQHRFKAVQVESLGENRPFDIPWMVLDSSAASTHWGWRPETPLQTVLTEIADFAETHPGWTDVSRNW